MGFVLGKAHTIPAMASKSCNAVGRRDLYSPLEATYAVNGRNYTITVNMYCFFGTRININNLFSNLVVGGVQCPNTTINGWVDKNEPGKVIATVTFSGHFNSDGTPDIRKRNIYASGMMTYHSDVSCQTLKTIPFSNEIEIEIENIEPSYTSPAVPTISLNYATDNRLVFDAATTSFGEGGGKFLFAELSKTNFGTVVKETDVINTLSGSLFAVNLQRNTRYYVRATAANNGMSASAATINATTLAASEIEKIEPIANGARISVIVYNGGGRYTPTTEIEQSTDLVNWTSIASTTSTTTYTKDQTLSSGQTYYFRTKTTTTAGVFYSDYVTFNAPGDLWGKITSIVPSANNATVNYTASVSGGGSIQVVFYYRVVGLEEEWLEATSTTITSGASKSFVLEGLEPNYFEYEVSANFRKGMKEYDTEPFQFHTIPVEISNANCDSLSYLAQLICQELEAIRRGNITVFMNNDTKKWCEDELDDTPTVASMLSRVNRFMHAVGCTICSMEGFIELLKDSKPNQVFMGKLGWVDIEDEVLEGSLNPVKSDAIYQAIDELIHKVWHYVGAYDFFGFTLADLQAQTGTNGATGIVGNKVYTWSSNAWRNPTTITPDNFGVIHINDGNYAGNGYYWFVDKWNRLDLDDKDIKRRLDAIDNAPFMESFDGNGYKVVVVDSTLTDAQINSLVPTDVLNDTIIIVAEGGA